MSMPMFSTHTVEFDGRFLWTVKASYDHWDWYRLSGGLAPDKELAEARADASLSLHRLLEGSSLIHQQHSG